MVGCSRGATVVAVVADVVGCSRGAAVAAVVLVLADLFFVVETA